MPVVTTEVDAKLGWLVLNRPEKLNAFSAELLTAFEAALEDLGANPDVSVIVVRGEGRAFSVGYDLQAEARYAAAPRAINDWVDLREKIDLWLKVWRCPKPVIAAVHGYCVGGATMLSVCCDLTVVADDTVIGWPRLPLGGGLAGPISLWLMGPKKAKEMSYIVGSQMTGVEAEKWGWANYAVPADQVLAKSEQLARQMAKTPAELLHLKKRALNRVMDMQGFSEIAMFGAEFDAIAHASDSYEHTKDEVRAFGMKEALRRFHADQP